MKSTLGVHFLRWQLFVNGVYVETTENENYNTHMEFETIIIHHRYTS